MKAKSNVINLVSELASVGINAREIVEMIAKLKIVKFV